MHDVPYSCMTRHKSYLNLRRISVQWDHRVSRGLMQEITPFTATQTLYGLSLIPAWLWKPSALSPLATPPSPGYLPPLVLPAGLDAYPAVGVNARGRAQQHGLGAQVVRHLDASVHNGQGDVVGALHALPAPQHQALGRLCADAQLEFVHQQSFLARRTKKCDC